LALISRLSWNIVANYVEICMGMLATLAPSRNLKKNKMILTQSQEGQFINIDEVEK
jgi:hypothetical protein